MSTAPASPPASEGASLMPPDSWQPILAALRQAIPDFRQRDPLVVAFWKDLANAQAARLEEVEAELAKVREENAHLKKSDDLNHELLASYERQLGITPADDTGTIGSRIDDLKSALTALRSALLEKVAEWRAKPWEGDRTAGAFDCADELESLAKEGK